MNFLAHALLAGDEPALIVGGVVGDWIKGTLPGTLPADLARGVALHRAIDAHAETHPAFCLSRTRISSSRRRYAGVLVDMYYDHLLAREDWLSSYARAEGVADVLARMSRRARQPNPLSGGMSEFLGNASGFEQDFHVWLADARAFCEQWRAIG